VTRSQPALWSIAGRLEPARCSIGAVFPGECHLPDPGAFAARLKDATGLDAVRDDLASAVQHVPEPARVRLRISQRG